MKKLISSPTSPNLMAQPNAKLPAENLYTYLNLEKYHIKKKKKKKPNKLDSLQNDINSIDLFDSHHLYSSYGLVMFSLEDGTFDPLTLTKWFCY